MEQKTEKYTLILAAIFHDIGKLWKVIEPNYKFENSEYSNLQMVNENAIIWRKAFFNEKSAILPRFPEMNELKNWYGNENIPQLKLIDLAEKMSLGLKDEPNSSPDIDLTSIFSILYKYDKNNVNISNSSYFFPIQQLTTNALPIPNESNSMDKASLQNLWISFLNDLKLLKSLKIKAYTDSLLTLFQKYFWCINTLSKERPDVSFYDHARTTASIIACLYEEFKFEEITAESYNQHRFLLLNGDLSGIQDFIYKITSKMAGKSLKGRSFYLQLLCDASAKFIIHKFDLPECNIILSSGGGFYILLPMECNSILKEAEKEINSYVLEEFNFELYLTLGSVPISINDFISNAFVDKWSDVKNVIIDKKKKKYSNIINDNEIFFEPYNPEYFTLDFLKKNECLKNYELEALDECFDLQGNQDSAIIPKNYIKYVRLAQNLFKTNYVIEIINSEVEDSNILHFKFGCITISYIFKDKINYEEIKNYNHCTIKILNNNKIDELNFMPDSNCSIAIKYYGGNKLPVGEYNIPLSLEKIAGKEEDDLDSKKFNKIAILRMDVDNLGETFINGLKYSEKQESSYNLPVSISKIANLSFLLDYYFSGYLNTIIKEYENSAYIVYAGGDDLFILGKWDLIPQIAKRIYSDFRKFVSYNAKMTLSGSIEIIDPNYPIYRAALVAGEHEREAKDFCVGTKSKEKDSLYFISKPLRLRDFEIDKESDWQFVEELKDFIVDSQKSLGNKGVLNRFREIYLEFYQNYYHLTLQNENTELKIDEINDLLKFNKWRWKAAYSFARFETIIKEKMPQQFKEFSTSIYDNSYKKRNYNRHLIALTDVAIRWAEFKLKNIDKEIENV